MAVTMETKNVRVSVQEALSNMVEAYQNIETWANEGTIKAIEIILEENINKVCVYLHSLYFCSTFDFRIN